jgi:hypothetical protein
MVGSIVAMDPRMFEGSSVMTSTEMERQLENLDLRLARVEQILPTLATKDDLERFATKADLERFATKADLERFATKADLERFATKADLERFATKAELMEGLAQQRALTESVRDEVRTVAEGHQQLVEGHQQLLKGHQQLVLVVDAVRYTLDTLVMRLEAKGVI